MIMYRLKASLAFNCWHVIDKEMQPFAPATNQPILMVIDHEKKEVH